MNREGLVLVLIGLLAIVRVDAPSNQYDQAYGSRKSEHGISITFEVPDNKEEVFFLYQPSDPSSFEYIVYFLFGTSRMEDRIVFPSNDIVGDHIGDRWFVMYITGKNVMFLYPSLKDGFSLRLNVPVLQARTMVINSKRLIRWIMMIPELGDGFEKSENRITIEFKLPDNEEEVFFLYQPSDPSSFKYNVYFSFGKDKIEDHIVSPSNDIVGGPFRDKWFLMSITRKLVMYLYPNNKEGFSRILNVTELQNRKMSINSIGLIRWRMVIPRESDGSKRTSSTTPVHKPTDDQNREQEASDGSKSTSPTTPVHKPSDDQNPEQEASDGSKSTSPTTPVHKPSDNPNPEQGATAVIILAIVIAVVIMIGIILLILYCFENLARRINGGLAWMAALRQ